MGPYGAGEPVTGPPSGDWRAAAREGFSSPLWTDNVARMHLFAREHPDVAISTPMENGSGEFQAEWPGGDAADASLGWLMDKLEQHFGRP